MTSAADLRSCADCADDLDHCHGTVVVHAALELECTEAGCAAHPDRHAWQVACADTGCRCEDEALGGAPELTVHRAWAPTLADREPGGRVRAA